MKGKRGGSSLGIVTVLIILLISSGCRSMLRYPAVDLDKEPFPEVQLADSMNPFLLTSITSPKLVVEVDWVEGSKPAPRAIKAFSKLLQKYNPPDREIEVIVDQMIPKTDWARLAPNEVPEPALFEKYLSRDPRAPGEEVYHVLFVPGAHILAMPRKSSLKPPEGRSFCPSWSFPPMRLNIARLDGSRPTRSSSRPCSTSSGTPWAWSGIRVTKTEPTVPILDFELNSCANGRRMIGPLGL